MASLVLAVFVSIVVPGDWAAVEALTPGETVQVVQESGKIDRRIVAGADRRSLFLFAPAFERLTRSARHDVLRALQHAPHAISRIVNDDTTIQYEATLISRAGIVRNGVTIATFEAAFEGVASSEVVQIARTLHPGRRGATIGALIGIPHGLMALQGCDTPCREAPLAVASAIAIDAALGYLIGRSDDRLQVVFER